MVMIWTYFDRHPQPGEIGMPTYDYICDSNGQVVEVKHAMSSEVHSWGELCELAAIDAQGTPLDAPVRRLATGGQVMSGRNTAKAEPAAAVPAATGHRCAAGCWH